MDIQQVGFGLLNSKFEYMIKKSVIPQIIGTWKLECIYYKTPKNVKVDLYGTNPNGILMYDKFGYMNAQIGFSERSHLKEMNPEDDDLKIASHDTFMAYYGKYYEKEYGVIIHEVEGCLKPSWEGMNETRYVTINDDILYITTPETIIDGVNTIIEVFWKRVV